MPKQFTFGYPEGDEVAAAKVVCAADGSEKEVFDGNWDQCQACTRTLGTSATIQWLGGRPLPAPVLFFYVGPATADGQRPSVAPLHDVFDLALKGHVKPTQSYDGYD
jgi:hypothetical protein